MVGLGNPGPEYAAHRHNLGHMVVDTLAARSGERFRSLKAYAEVAQTRLAGRRAVLAKPRSFMNESGGPVAALCSYYRVPLGQLVVVHDELDIDFAAVRVKSGGSDAGHNGLRSVTRSLHSPDYRRVRVGVGRPRGRGDAADFVLSGFSSAERRELGLLLERAADAVECLVGEGLAAAQNRFNAAAPLPRREGETS